MAGPERLPPTQIRCPACGGICGVGSDRCRHCGARTRNALDPNRGLEVDPTELALFGVRDAVILGWLRGRGVPVYSIALVLAVVALTALFWWAGQVTGLVASDATTPATPTPVAPVTQPAVAPGPAVVGQPSTLAR